MAPAEALHQPAGHLRHSVIASTQILCCRGFGSASMRNKARSQPRDNAKHCTGPEGYQGSSAATQLQSSSVCTVCCCQGELGSGINRCSLGASAHIGAQDGQRCKPLSRDPAAVGRCGRGGSVLTTLDGLGQPPALACPHPAARLPPAAAGRGAGRPSPASEGDAWQQWCRAGW